MEIENIKAQAREEIERLMPHAEPLTKEWAVAVYISGAVYAVEESHSRPYENADYHRLTDELRNPRHAQEANG